MFLLSTKCFEATQPHALSVSTRFQACFESGNGNGQGYRRMKVSRGENASYGWVGISLPVVVVMA